MKLEHLIQAYKVNNIKAVIKDVNNGTEKAGTISFADEIYAAYLLDNEEVIISIKLLFNCLKSLKAKEQISYITKVLNIIQQTIMLLSNISQKECNMILEKL